MGREDVIIAEFFTAIIRPQSRVQNLQLFLSSVISLGPAFTSALQS